MRVRILERFLGISSLYEKVWDMQLRTSALEDEVRVLRDRNEQLYKRRERRKDLKELRERMNLAVDEHYQEFPKEVIMLDGGSIPFSETSN